MTRPSCLEFHGLSQRVHVGIWYILKAQWGSHIPTLRPKYIPYSYMGPLGMGSRIVTREEEDVSQCIRRNIPLYRLPSRIEKQQAAQSCSRAQDNWAKHLLEKNTLIWFKHQSIP